MVTKAFQSSELYLTKEPTSIKHFQKEIDRPPSTSEAITPVANDNAPQGTSDDTAAARHKPASGHPKKQGQWLWHVLRRFFKRKEGKRDLWTQRVQFHMAITGYVIGLGNAWRFPYVAYLHGGAAFLVSYIILLFLVAIPLFLLELVMGQHVHQDPNGLFLKIAPAFRGLGWSMAFLSFMVLTYHNVILAWSIYFIMDGFRAEVPYYKDQKGYFDEMLGREKGVSYSFDNYGSFNPLMMVCLAGAWAIIWFALAKGVRGSVQLIYCSVLYPYVCLIFLFAVAISLKGASRGMLYYLKPEWSHVVESSCWTDAAAQVFFSLGISLGGNIVFASYNKSNWNCYHGGIFVAMFNACTSFVFGFIVFCILGHMADELGISSREQFV